MGLAQLPLHLVGNAYSHSFVLAGADFLGANNLNVNVSAKCLTHATTYTSLDLEPTSDAPTGLAPVLTSDFDCVLLEFPEVLRPTLDEPSVRHAVQHHSTTFRQPASLYPARYDDSSRIFWPKQRRNSTESSEWASSVAPPALGLRHYTYVVQKADGTFRPCGDYR